MSDKNFTTRTASLKATSIDAYKTKTNKLTINDIPFSKVISSNVPENPTDNDMWKYVATTDDKGVVTINSDISFDYSEMTTEQRDITRTATKVIDNKVLGENDELLMNWDTKSFTNSKNNSQNLFGIFGQYSSKLETFDSDLSSLTNGQSMFSGCYGLESFNSDLSSLTNGSYMFDRTALESFNSDLSSLTNGSYMFQGCSKLTTFDSDLSSLTNGDRMFQSCSKLTTFDSDLSSLTNGDNMFNRSALESFNSDLSSLTNGWQMFYKTALESFNSDLSSLTNGEWMFYQTNLASFNGDLSSLTNGIAMFYQTNLASFNGDLSSLVDGSNMFSNTQARHYNIRFWEMVDGVKTEVIKTFQSEGLKEVVSDFSSLKSGIYMFGGGGPTLNSYIDDNGNEVTERTYSISPLSEESIMFIAETINDISELDTTNDEHWKYVYHDFNGNESTSSITSTFRGKIHLGYDSSITDTTNIMKYCDQIANKGWTVFLNGSQQTPNNGAIETANLSDDSVQTPIPHYYKPLQVTDDDVAEYVDSNGNYYIIIGGQHIFGDDLSTYGMFTSYEHAISEITLGLGLTKYVKPTEEETESKEEK